MSVSDLVGRSFRWFRANARFLFRILVVPCFIYEVIWEAHNWLTENPSVPGSGKLLLFLLLALTLISYELGVRQIAVWRLMTGKDSDSKSALKNARKPYVLLLFLPSVAVELFLALALFFIADYSLQAQGTKGGDALSELDDLLAILGIIGLALILLPASCVVFWNSIIACLKEMEGVSTLRALARVVYFQLRAPVFVMWALGFFATVGFLVELPVLAISLAELPKLADGTVGTVQECTTRSIDIVASTAMEVLFLGYQIAAATCIYNELRMRLEGADIIRKLNALKQGR